MIELKKYKVGVRALQFFVFSVPLGAHLTQPQTHFLFPPLGDASGFLAAVVLALIGLFALLPWTFSLGGARHSHLISLGLAVAFCLWYASLTLRFVVGVPVPSQGKFIYVSIGSERSRNADLYFPSETAQQMLSERGPREEEVRWLYTDDSIDRARNELFASYVGMLVCINLTIGLFAMKKLEADAAMSTQAR